MGRRSNADQERFPQRQYRVDRFHLGRKFEFDANLVDIIVFGFEISNQEVGRAIPVTFSEKV
jgi:hypothetical protein